MAVAPEEGLFDTAEEGAEAWPSQPQPESPSEGSAQRAEVRQEDCCFIF